MERGIVTLGQAEAKLKICIQFIMHSESWSFTHCAMTKVESQED